MINHKEHKFAESVMTMSNRGMTSELISRLYKLDKRLVRLIKLAHQDPKAYSEWQMMEQKRLDEEAKDKSNYKDHGMTPLEHESCKLAKLWK